MASYPRNKCYITLMLYAYCTKVNKLCMCVCEIKKKPFLYTCDVLFIQVYGCKNVLKTKKPIIL